MRPQQPPQTDSESRDGEMRLFVRVSSLPNPVPVVATQDMTVAAFKRVFLDAYTAALQQGPQHASNSTLHASSFECRLVCRGQELADGANLSTCTRPGDHLHALVRESAAAADDAAAQPNAIESGTSGAAGGAAMPRNLRAEAQHWASELRRFLNARQQTAVAQGTATRTAPMQRGTAAGPSTAPHQQTMRLQTAFPQGSNLSRPPTESTTELGGSDGQTHVVVSFEDALPEGAAGGTTITSEALLRIVSTASTSPSTILCGMACGYFLGLVVLIFLFATRSISIVFRLGLVVGLLSNVFLGCLLPHSTLVAFR